MDRLVPVHAEREVGFIPNNYISKLKERLRRARGEVRTEVDCSSTC